MCRSSAASSPKMCTPDVYKRQLFYRGAQSLRRTEAFDARATAADVGLDHHGIADSFCRGDGLRRMIDDDGLGIGQAEFFQIGKLQSFGSFVSEAAVTIYYAKALGLEVGQIIQRVENAMAQATLPG